MAFARPIWMLPLARLGLQFIMYMSLMVLQFSLVDVGVDVGIDASKL